MTINVAVIDDHTLVREAVCQMIDSEPDLAVVGQAGGVSEGRALLSRQPIHVLVVDVTMPDGSGLALARAAREASPRLGIVVLTMHNDDETLLEALDLGASALVLKAAPSEEVIAAVRRAAVAPDAFMATGLAQALRRRAHSDRPSLTPRETEVLERLVAGDSIADVAKRLYMSESTVKTHVSKVYEKLGAHNRASAVMAALRHGLVRPEAGAPATSATASSGRASRGGRARPPRARPALSAARTPRRCGAARPDHDDEQRRQDPEHDREEDLDRDLLRLLLGELTPHEPHLEDCSRSTDGDGQAEAVGLDERRDEVLGLRDGGAVRQGGERLAPRLADLDLRQDAGELTGDRARHGAGHLEQRGVEALARLDAHGEHVERVGQPAPQLLLVLHPALTRSRSGR